MDSAKTHYYVQVNDPSGTEYYVGPFEESGASFAHGRAAIDWIYRQVGLLKTSYPNAELIKHKWHYQERANGFEEPIVEVSVEISGYRMEIKKLQPPAFRNVIEEIIERKPTTV